MTKEELLTVIKTAFKNVRLADGIGLWQGQGIDDYADLNTIAELRKKDEKMNWDNIPYKDLAACSSSLSFFDAKGMRFHLPKFMIFDLFADEIYEKEQNYSPDVLFTLGYNLDEEYQKNRFSLFNKEQTQAIIHFLEYKLDDFTQQYKEYYTDDISSNHQYLELVSTLNEWKKRSNL
jgi:hypothetical protein